MRNIQIISYDIYSVWKRNSIAKLKYNFITIWEIFIPYKSLNKRQNPLKNIFLSPLKQRKIRCKKKRRELYLYQINLAQYSIKIRLSKMGWISYFCWRLLEMMHCLDNRDFLRLIDGIFWQAENNREIGQLHKNFREILIRKGSENVT